MSALRRDSAEWLEARREVITSTDLPVILGLSPYRSEADLAAEKADGEREPENRAMRLGKLLEAVIRDEDELEHGIRLRRVNRFLVHPTFEWAATSLDFERVGERCVVEAKASASGRWDGGLPQDVEAQVRWQMGVAGYPAAHVAVLRSGSRLQCFDVEHDPDQFAGLVDIAADFRARLAAGGPFAESPESVKRRYPADDGTEMTADAEVAETVRALVEVRGRRKALQDDEDRLETAIKARMGAHAAMAGPGFRVTWKRTKDVTTIDWQSVADGLLRQLPETERAALVGLATTVREGFRPFRVVLDKED